MLKKIFAISLLILLLLLTASLTSMAALEDDIQLLVDLGVVEKQEESRVIEKTYTRGAFAAALSKMDGEETAITVDAESSVKYASDIAGDKNLVYIADVLVRNIMTVKDGRFSPGGALSQNDAVRGLINVLGYAPVAERNGGTDSAYYALANKLGILKGVVIKDSNALSYKEAAKLIYNAMKVPLFESNPYIIPEKKTFFDEMGVLEHTGTVVANSAFGISSSRVSSTMVNISGNIIPTAIRIEDSFVGCNVVYYTMPVNGDRTVVSMRPSNGTDTVTINAADIENVSTSGNRYLIDYGEKRELALSKTAFMIVNHKTQSPTRELFDVFESGSVTFVDTDNDGIYDLGHMTLLQQGILQGVAADGESAVVKVAGRLYTVDLSEVESLECYIGKNVASVSELKADMTIGVGCEKFTITSGVLTFDFDKAESIKMFASNRIEKGYVSTLEENKIYLDEMDYDLGTAYYKFVSKGEIPAIKLGTGVVLYIDIYGDVAYYEIDPEAKGMEYGYLVKAALDNGALKNVLYLKIMDKNGKIDVYEVTDKKFRLDGAKTTVNTSSLVYSVGGTTVDLAKRQLVRFRAEDKTLKELDTTALGSNESALDSLTEDRALETEIRVTNGAIGRNYVLSTSGIIFIDDEYPAETNPDDKAFSVMQADKLENSDDYVLIGYDANDMNELGAIVWPKRHGQTESATVTFDSELTHHKEYSHIVEKVRVGTNKDGDEGWYLTIAGPGGKSTYFVLSDARLGKVTDSSVWDEKIEDLTAFSASEFDTEIKSGDIIRFRTNVLGYIDYVEKLFDFEKNTSNPYSTLKSNFDADGQDYTFVNIVKGNDESIMYSETSDIESRENKFVFKKNTIYKTVPVYNVQEKTVYMVNFADVPSAMKGNVCLAFLRYYAGRYVRDHIFYQY